MRSFVIQLAAWRRTSMLFLSAALAIAGADVSAAEVWFARETANALLPAPRAVTPFTTFSFGDVYGGEVISQIFIIRNDGDADLQIKGFIAGCGCAATRWDSVIAPGKEGTATLEVQTVSQSGGIFKTAEMHTNDPDRPTITFSLSANVLKGTRIRQGRYIGPVFLSPETRAAMYASAGKTSTIEFSITADNTPVKILGVEGGTKHFASQVEVIEPGRSYKIVVKSLPIETGDLYTDHLRVVTDNETLPAFTIEVALRVYSKQ